MVKINISKEESSHIELLYLQYKAYLDMLGYLIKDNSLDEQNKFYDAKWNETVKIYLELEQAKAMIDEKYHPEGNFSNFYFDFNHCQVIYD